MSDCSFNVGDRVEAIIDFSHVKKGMTGEVKAKVERLVSPDLGMLIVVRWEGLAGQGHNGHSDWGNYVCPIGDKSICNLYNKHLKLVQEEQDFTVAFPVDVFDHRIFYTREWQEASYKSTTGTGL